MTKRKSPDCDGCNFNLDNISCTNGLVATRVSPNSPQEEGRHGFTIFKGWTTNRCHFKPPETDYDHANIGTCENCHKENVKVRKIEAYGMFGSANRGFYNICFECFKPRVKFRGRDGRNYESPVDAVVEK